MNLCAADLRASLIGFYLSCLCSVLRRNKLKAIKGDLRRLLEFNIIYSYLSIDFNIITIFLHFYPIQIVGIWYFTLSIFLIFFVVLTK